MERWEKINGYEHYEISESGQVRSHYGGKTKVLKTTISKKNGNRRIKLYENGKANTVNISTIMGNVYLGRTDKQKVYHVNGVVTDDRLSNLTLEIENATINYNKKSISKRGR